MMRFAVVFSFLVLGITLQLAGQSNEAPSAAALVNEVQAAAPSTEKAEAAAEKADEQDTERLADKLDGAGERLATALEQEWGLTRSVSRQLGELVDYRLMGVSLAQMLASLFILIVTLIFRGIVTMVLFRYFRRFTSKTKSENDDKFLDALEKPVSTFLLIAGFFLALMVLPMSSTMDAFIVRLFRGLSMLVVVWGVVRMIDVGSNVLARTAQKRNSSLVGFLPVLRKSIKVFVVIVGVLMIVDNLGYNVSGILATLGIGGAALAFASKDTIANGFGTLMIMLDRPFQVGDWIMVGDKVDGDVESIGLRSTKVRTWPKTVLSIPNGVLANEYINNWSRMPKRRVKQYVGISYEATADDMEGLVEDIRQLLKEDEGVQQDFILVNFTDFGDSSLDILVYYFTITTAWLPHMDIRQRVNCKIMRAIKARGLSIAFPTRSLYLDGPVANKLADLPYESRWASRSGSVPGSEGRLPGDFGPDSPR